jgi:pyridoxal phosphate enzyme (YggS family)
MSRISDSLEAVRERIARTCASYGRPPQAVRLVAVGKGFPPAALREALGAGQRDFGESYLQEAVAKIPHLPRAGLAWHFIGPIQSNKTRGVAEHFDWAHGIERLSIAERLSAQRPEDIGPLSVCVQVNISGEASKSGCAPTEAADLCRAVAALPRLQLRGLMAIPAPGRQVRRDFRRLNELYESLRRSGLQLDTLSAGMSDDLEDAIAEGSTLVRVGTAIFGSRQK